MPGPPQREDIFDVIRRLEEKVNRLERTVGFLAQGILVMPDSVQPPTPPSGGIFYVESGIVKYLNSSGVPRTVTVV